MVLSPAAVVDCNLCEAMRFFGSATDKGGVHDYAGVTVIDSGVNYSVFNISLFRDPPVANRIDFNLRLTSPEQYFQRRGVRWSHWVCLDLLPTDLRSRADEAFRQRGLRRLTEAPNMIASRLEPAQRPLPPVSWRPVADAETRLSFAHITSIAFEIPFATAREVYKPAQAWNGTYQGYVGYVRNTPVSTAAIVVAGGVIGVYSVGTLPGFRKRGYAEALLRNVLAYVTRVTGIEQYALQSTRAGYDMYRCMGFADVARFAVYMT